MRSWTFLSRTENLNLNNNFRELGGLRCTFTFFSSYNCMKLFWTQLGLWQQPLPAYFIAFSALTVGSVRSEMCSRQDNLKMKSGLSETFS